jgi:hypothetical protein
MTTNNGMDEVTGGLNLTPGENDGTPTSFDPLANVFSTWGDPATSQTGDNGPSNNQITGFSEVSDNPIDEDLEPKAFNPDDIVPFGSTPAEQAVIKDIDEQIRTEQDPAQLIKVIKDRALDAAYSAYEARLAVSTEKEVDDVQEASVEDYRGLEVLLEQLKTLPALKLLADYDPFTRAIRLPEQNGENYTDGYGESLLQAANAFRLKRIIIGEDDLQNTTIVATALDADGEKYLPLPTALRVGALHYEPHGQNGLPVYTVNKTAVGEPCLVINDGSLKRVNKRII